MATNDERIPANFRRKTKRKKVPTLRHLRDKLRASKVRYQYWLGWSTIHLNKHMGLIIKDCEQEIKELQQLIKEREND